MIPFQVTIIGSGSAIPSLHRAATSQLVHHNGNYILIDCAEGTQLLLKKIKISPMRIDHILISHLHGDHYFGLAGLINSLHLIGRNDPLNIYGPAQLFDIIDLQLKVADTSLRYPLIFKPLIPDGKQLVFETRQLKIWSFPVKHRIPTWGFQLTEKVSETNQDEHSKESGNPFACETPITQKGGACLHKMSKMPFPAEKIDADVTPARSYAYCTDTAFCPDTASYIKGVDLLYHEATFMENLAKTAEATFHSTTKQAAEIAKMSEAGKLIIGHFSSRYTDLDPLLEESRKIFQKTDLALDGMTFSIGEK